MVKIRTYIHVCMFLQVYLFLKENMKNKKFKPLIAVCLIAGLAVYFFWIRPKYNQMNIASASANNGVEVTVVKVEKKSVQLFTELPARVTAHKISEVRPQIEGIIKKINFLEGSFVKQGQQLYQIDPIIYQSASDGAMQTLKAMQAKRDRYKNLLEQDAISKQEFDDIEASLAQAKADANKARKNFDYTKVLAPISGYIGKSNVTEGALVTANQSAVLVTITQLDPIYVDIEQPSKDVIAIGHHKEIPVSVLTEDSNYQNTGTLKFSEKFADPSTDSVRLRAIFSNKEQKLIPGMFVTAKLHLEPFDAVIVPQRTTNRAPNGSLTVFVVGEDNVAKTRQIKAEKIYQNYWIVEDGLSEGETIVYEGFQKITDGAKVKPVPLAIEEKK